MNNLTAIGLIYDIIGVIILGMALMGIRRRELLMQAGTYWGGNKAMFRALVLQRMDANFGLPILVLGFALQLAGAANVVLPFVEPWMFVIPLALVLIAHLIARRQTSKGASRLFDKLVAEVEADSDE